MTETVSRANGPIVNPLWPGPCLLVQAVLECLPVGAPNQNSSWAATCTNYTAIPLAGNPSPRPFEKKAAPPETGHIC